MARRIRKTKAEGRIAHKKTIVDNITFDSKTESKYYIYLKELKAKGIVTKIELQVPFILQDKYIIFNNKVIYGSDKDFNKIKRKYKCPTILAIKYIADFVVTYSDGHVEVIDTKGILTPEFKIKEKLLKCKYPNINFKVLALVKNEWVDYYEHQKELRLKKRQANKKGGK
ncbi:MAG: DUF1064 domain-containing protein [Terrisporobacter sp.]|uniref:DUF1064 domain-containing protein n=1 Tax=Terrisporobacter sp. TaxID=1965305 RepID=UPI002A912368|nr:DUF1064 domain-containing protein [Terrisporobacter sp.]MDY6153205.1 DUF1064 domain-containing protein [Terrisporobacter sp.]